MKRSATMGMAGPCLAVATLATAATAILCLALGGCSSWEYHSDGRAWDIASGGAVEVGPIQPVRDVTVSVTGTIDRGAVIVIALVDGDERGEPVILTAGPVDSSTRYDYEAGLWSFRATADADASGSLYLAISDR